jgi:hypothetical protein
MTGRRQAGDGGEPPPRILLWQKAVRDAPDRPPPMQRLVLDSLTLRVDWQTGKGFASAAALAGDADVGERTVRRATAWARGRGLLVMEKRGHRLTDEAAKATEWLLRLPPQPATGGRLEDAPTGHGRPVGEAQPAKRGHPNRPIEASQPVSPAPPSRPITSRPSTSPARAARDPRTLLLGLGADERLTEHITGWLDDRGIGDPFGYLLGIIGKHPDAEDGIRQFLDRRRRELAGADDDQPPRLPKPPWCGECDADTRLVELDDGRMARCLRCHPLSVHPPEDSGSSWPPWCGDPDCNPATRWRDSPDGLHADKCPKCHPDLAAGGGP